MIHLRIVAPGSIADEAVALLEGDESVVNVVRLPGVALKPAGDVVLCDVAHEDASVVVADLRELGIAECGSIALEEIDTEVSAAGDRAVRLARGDPADAVVWEQVEARTSESVTLSATYLVFMALAALIAGVGIFLDSPILVIGGMVVGPEFGPIAGFCVAAVQRRPALALRGGLALLIGLSVAVTASLLAAAAFRATGITPQTFTQADHGLAAIIANPDVLSFFVACCAGIAGVLSLSTQKSSALIGVVISVTTLPAAANIGIALTYGDGGSLQGSLAQLALNITGILMAGLVTLAAQRLLYLRRWKRHRREAGPSPATAAPSTPAGSSG